ncbi:hypothetical protein [Hartmannibacter diazotrophicus]|uniref:hypothetical protein n=1 Tax=Hartmannibacter diazotrophicus TaxID=1482074 RepID=UPI000C14DEFC|nr:hypothetical protein [Hartmannibacter diazotrophicus]
MVPLVAALLTTDVGAVKRRVERKTVVYALVAVLLLTAYAAAVTGGAILLAADYGAVAAAFLVAIAALVLAMLLIAVNMMIDRRDRRLMLQRQAQAQPILASAMASLLPSVMKSPLLSIVVFVGAAAFFMANSSSGKDGDSGDGQA